MTSRGRRHSGTNITIQTLEPTMRDKTLPPDGLSKKASRLTSNYIAMQERARSTALESMRRRRSSARTGRRSNVVQPEGMAAATPWAFHEYESYKYALDDRCDVSWASSDPSLLWHRYDGEESRIHFERRMDLDKRYRFKFHAVVLLLVGLIGVGIAIIAASQIIAAALLHAQANSYSRSGVRIGARSEIKIAHY